MMRKKIFLALLLLAMLVLLLYSDLILYGIRQGTGQLSIVWNARPVEEVVNDPETPDSVRQALQFVDEVRRFAVERLGLRDTENYTTYYDQQGRELMWVVTASQPYAMEEYTWDFPVVGKVPYKGFFREDLARAEAEGLKADSLDVNLRNPDGWSTLGWFRDPILSGMLDRSRGDLASLIIHELAHATIFVSDSVDFNENLASFIGDEGARLFLLEKFGPASADLREYLETESDYRKLSDHMVRASTSLDSLYKSVSHLHVEEKRKLKKDHIRAIVHALDTLSCYRYRGLSERYGRRLPNNATFMSFGRYHSLQDHLLAICRTSFGSDLPRMIRHFRARFPEG